MADKDLVVTWVDHRRESQQPPNPAYPAGIDVDGAGFERPACQTKLPYPAKRCGMFVISCRACRIKVMLTTAGRPDDPRSVKIACKRKPH